MKAIIRKQSTYLRKDPIIKDINSIDDLFNIMDASNCSISLSYEEDMEGIELEIIIMDDSRNFFS